VDVYGSAARYPAAGSAYIGHGRLLVLGGEWVDYPAELVGEVVHDVCIAGAVCLAHLRCQAWRWWALLQL
jgi:hypothetical protein